MRVRIYWDLPLTKETAAELGYALYYLIGWNDKVINELTDHEGMILSVDYVPNEVLFASFRWIRVEIENNKKGDNDDEGNQTNFR